jgi:hypothetical protein
MQHWERDPDGRIRRAEGAGERAGAKGDRAVLGRGLRLGLRDAYDHLGAGVVGSLWFTVLAGAGFFGGQALGARVFGGLPGVLPFLAVTATALLGLALLGGPAAAGLFRFARKAAAREEPEVFDLVWGFRGGLRPATRLAAVQAFATATLAGNAAFYFGQGHLGAVVLGALCAYAGLFWLAACLYQWPLLAQYPAAGVGSAVRKSALLVLGNPGYTAGVLGVLAACAGLAAVTVAGAILVLPGLAAALATQATRELLRRYGLLGPDPTLDPVTQEVEW